MKKNILTKRWFAAAGIRALKTAAQTLLGVFTIGQAFDEIQWYHALSCAGVAAIYSMVTSLAGLPELDEGEEETWN